MLDRKRSVFVGCEVTLDGVIDQVEVLEEGSMVLKVMFEHDDKPETVIFVVGLTRSSKYKEERSRHKVWDELVGSYDMVRKGHGKLIVTVSKNVDVNVHVVLEPKDIEVLWRRLGKVARDSYSEVVRQILNPKKKVKQGIARTVGLHTIKEHRGKGSLRVRRGRRMWMEAARRYGVPQNDAGFKELLIKLRVEQKWSEERIAGEVGVSQATVSNYLRMIGVKSGAFGCPRNQYGPRTAEDIERWLLAVQEVGDEDYSTVGEGIVGLHNDKGMSRKEIADLLGCSIPTVLRGLKGELQY